MLALPFFSTKWPVSCLLAGALLALPARPAQAQTPTSPAKAWAWLPPGTLLYLDGRPSTLTEIQRIPDDSIQSAGGFRFSAVGADSLPRPGSNVMVPSIELIVTKANANSPAVLAMADRFDLWPGYVEVPASVSAIAPRALAYITSHYPQAWLGGEVMARTQKSTGAVRYHVQLADRWGWHYVDFTPEGEVIEHPLAAPEVMRLALTLSYPHAVVPVSSRPVAPIYLDGQRSSPEAVRALHPDSLTSVTVLNQDVAPLLTPDAAGLGLLLISTWQGQRQPATRVFNERVRQLALIQRLAAHSHKTLPAMLEPATPAQPADDLGEIQYYLDGRPIAWETVEKLNSDNIASIDVVSGKDAPTTAGGIVLLRTKQLAANSPRLPRRRVN